MNTLKSDMKLFRQKVPKWQERHMARLLEEYNQLINDESKLPSERFHALYDRMKEDRRHPGVYMDMDKQYITHNIIRLINDHTITRDEINDFSQELQDEIDLFYRRIKMLDEQ